MQRSATLLNRPDNAGQIIGRNGVRQCGKSLAFERNSIVGIEAEKLPPRIGPRTDSGSEIHALGVAANIGFGEYDQFRSCRLGLR